MTQYAFFIKVLVTLKLITISRYTRTDCFVNTLLKITALPDPIFKKLAKIQQQSVQITHTDFHPYRTINVEFMDIKSFQTELRLPFTTYIIKKTALRGDYNEFRQNLSWNMESMDRISLRPNLSVAVTKISRNSRLVHVFRKGLLIKFHENPTDFSVADTRSRT